MPGGLATEQGESAKAELYARCGIPELWVVDVKDTSSICFTGSAGR